MSFAARLKQVGYLLKSRPYGLEKPVVLQFPVIDICNSQCQMCRIWENKQSDDISPEALRSGLRNPLFDRVSAVGLNGGEPTLRKDLATLTSVLFDELPSLRTIALITNAYRYEEVIERIQEVGEVVKARGGKFDVMVSLDGYGEVHDRVRGKPGNFGRAQHVTDFIQRSALVDNVRIGCTIIRENVYGLHDLLAYCQRRGLYIKYRLGIPHQRLYTQNLLDPYALNFEEKYHVAEFLEGLIQHYEPLGLQRLFYRSLVDQIVHAAPRKAGCDWQHRGATITSKGELLYCAVQSKSLGLITEQDSEAAYFGNIDHLRQIIDTKCDRCHHDYMGLPPRSTQARQMATGLLRRAGAYSTPAMWLRSAWLAPTTQRRRFEARRAELATLATGPLQPTARLEGGPRRVLICGWYGTETLGDKAILGGVTQAIRAALGGEPVEFSVVSLHPYVTQMTRRQMPELKDARVVSVEDGMRLVRRVDLLVFGGGPLMGVAELADMEALFRAAQDHGVPRLVAGCGVGPLGEEWHSASMRSILKAADSRIYRDEQSRARAAQFGIDTTDDIVAEDPAFAWLLHRAPSSPSAPRPDGKVLLLGLRDFPHEQYARHLSPAQCLAAKERYEREVVLALEELVRRHPDLTILPLPMCTNHFGGDDRWFYRRLLEDSLVLAPRLDRSLLAAELKPSDYCDAFRTATVALTMRFHSLVFALGIGVPTVAIDYTLGQGKVADLTARFGVASQSLADLDGSFLVTAIEHQMSMLPSPERAPAFRPTFFDAVAKVLPSLLSATARSAPALS